MIVKKIDLHVHSVPEKGLLHRHNPKRMDYTTPEELRAMYDALGIERGVQLPAISTECGYHVVTNEASYQMVQNIRLVLQH